MATTAEELHTVIDHLSAEDQARMLAYARELAQLQTFPVPLYPLAHQAAPLPICGYLPKVAR